MRRRPPACACACASALARGEACAAPPHPARAKGWTVSRRGKGERSAPLTHVLFLRLVTGGDAPRCGREHHRQIRGVGFVARAPARGRAGRRLAGRFSARAHASHGRSAGSIRRLLRGISRSRPCTPRASGVVARVGLAGGTWPRGGAVAQLQPRGRGRGLGLVAGARQAPLLAADGLAAADAAADRVGVAQTGRLRAAAARVRRRGRAGLAVASAACLRGQRGGGCGGGPAVLRCAKTAWGGER